MKEPKTHKEKIEIFFGSTPRNLRILENYLSHNLYDDKQILDILDKEFIEHKYLEDLIEIIQSFSFKSKIIALDLYGFFDFKEIKNKYCQNPLSVEDFIGILCNILQIEEQFFHAVKYANKYEYSHKVVNDIKKKINPDILEKMNANTEEGREMRRRGKAYINLIKTLQSIKI